MIKQWVGGSAHHKGVEKQGLGGLEGDTSHPAAAAPQLRYQMRSGGVGRDGTYLPSPVGACLPFRCLLPVPK